MFERAFLQQQFTPPHTAKVDLRPTQLHSVGLVASSPGLQTDANFAAWSAVENVG